MIYDVVLGHLAIHFGHRKISILGLHSSLTFESSKNYFKFLTHRWKLLNLYYHSARHLRLRQGCLSCNLLRRGKRPRIFPWLLYRVFLLLLHSIYIRAVSSCCLLPALMNCFELVFRPLWQSHTHTHRRLDY